MNVFLTVLLSVTLTNAIRVPSTWHEGKNPYKKTLVPVEINKYNKKHNENFEVISKKPHKSKSFQQNSYAAEPYSFFNPPQNPSFKSKKLTRVRNKWVPVAPYSINTNLGFMPSKPKLSPKDLKQYPKKYYSPRPRGHVRGKYAPLLKNYRDDTTHEKENDKDEYIEEFTTEINRPLEKHTSDHEKPLDIPTKPLYPGEGAWAKPGIVHKPFISKHVFSELKEDSDEKPDGYEIFEKGERLFYRKRKEFDNKHGTPTDHKTYKKSPQEQIEAESSDEEVDEFVPMTLYTQVRRSENEKHLPSDSEDSEGGRLKEVIKDSRIHTVYTEEGYEDSAYDHAGHEKEAEDAEGYKEYKKKEDGNKAPYKYTKTKRPDNDQDDVGTTRVTKTSNPIQYAASENSLKKLKQKDIPKNKNNFSKTKATKTMKVKESPDGTKMEVTSEVKLMTSPGNDDKTQQIIEIKPITSNVSGNDGKSNAVNISRKKRYANDFPKIDVEKDFITSITQRDLPQYKSQHQRNKYPYYQAKYVNQNSPLRYSENLDNIPQKTEQNMAFYEQANGIECPEVDEDVEEIPKRIQEVEESVSNGEALENNEEKSPRLGKLGQRINCFKRKYFGDNPLDSPFFQEKEIEPVPPVFKVFEEKTAGFRAFHPKPTQKYHSKFSMQNIREKNRKLPYRNRPEGERKFTPTNSGTENEALQERDVSPEVEVINVQNFRNIDEIITESPHISLLTTPDYSLDITPRNIYDQIELLDYLPSQTTEYPSTTPELEILRKGKLLEENSEQPIQPAELYYRQNPRYPPYNIQRQQVKRKRPQPQFDMNSFLLSQTSKTVNAGHRSFIKPNEISYGDQIMPEEQLNVFADVINNIKNGTNDPLRAASSYQKTRELNSINNAIKIKIPPKKVHIKPLDMTNYDRNLFYLTSTSTSPPTTTKKSKRGGIRYTTTTEADFYDDAYSDVDEGHVYGRKKISTTKPTTPEPEQEDVDDDEDAQVSETLNEQTVKTIKVDESTKILGLVPPSKWNYRTIYQPSEVSAADPEPSGSETINTFYVVGMKPPSTKQKVYHYNDFPKLLKPKTPNRFHKILRRRGKRSPNRRSYFEVVRGQNSESSGSSTKADDDDYVPHRPKNYHWDEKLKKIVYDNPKLTEEEEEDEEVVAIEVKDPIAPNIQQTTTRRSFTTTTPQNGPSYVDFVKALKSSNNYVSIPDPTTTKDGLTAESIISTTIKSEPTKPPEFLNIVSKLRQSGSYKLIEEKNKTTTTTTEAPEEEEEESEDTEAALSNVQNSPGRGAVDIGQNFKIFDVNDFLPKVKSFTPRTSIDYSKYKTIQRSPSRHTTPPSDEEEAVEIIRPQTTEQPTKKTTTQAMVEIIELSRRRPTTETISTTTSSTTIRPPRIRGRRPLTTPRTSAPSTASPKEDSVIITAQISKPKRVYPRRRPSHIRARTTTEKQNTDSSSEVTQKVVRRRHNTDETSDRKSKIISLESIIMFDQTNNTKKNGSRSLSSHQTQNVTVDDVLKDINLLKVVNVEDMIPDDGLSAKFGGDIQIDDDEIGKEEYFDEDHEINLDGENLTDRRLVISKDNDNGMYEYYYTPVQ